MAVPAAVRSCRAALAACVRHGHWAEALGALRSLRQLGFLDSAVLEMAMLSCARSSQWARTISLLDFMQRNLKLTSRAFIAAISAAERCGRWEPALVILRDAEILGCAYSPLGNYFFCLYKPKRRLLTNNIIFIIRFGGEYRCRLALLQRCSSSLWSPGDVAEGSGFASSCSLQGCCECARLQRCHVRNGQCCEMGACHPLGP